MTTLDHDPILPSSGARCLCGHIALALFPEREPEIWGFLDEVVNRSNDRRFPAMRRLWALFDVGIDALIEDVCRRLQNDLWRASLHTAANDDERAGCQTCRWPQRAAVGAEILGRGLALVASALRLRDAVRLRRALELFPSNLDEGHVLPLGLLRRSFLRGAAEFALAPADIRRVTRSIERVERLERANRQLCFDFARAA